MRRLSLLLAVALGCNSTQATTSERGSSVAPGPSSTSGAPSGPIGDASTPRPGGGDASAPSDGIAAKHPGDVGIGSDPDVVFADGYEDGSISAVTARYDDAKTGGLSLVADVPPKSPGKTSLKMFAAPAAPAADLFKHLEPGYDELWIRYYAKYQGGVQWHHTGVWIGGYDPPTSYPNPQAGTRPNGDDRFSISFEPIGANGSPNPLLDTYSYWMKMRSWMDAPSGNAAYYGNTTIHSKDVFVQDDAWMCVELHVKLNTDLSSGSGAELDVFLGDTKVAHFDDKGPLGCWIKDKFCTTTADTSACTKYPDLCKPPLAPLDLQLRSTSALKLSHFWPQNYVTDGAGGSFQIDDVVIAKSYVGCIR
jgi:hypothetical protein